MANPKDKTENEQARDAAENQAPNTASNPLQTAINAQARARSVADDEAAAKGEADKQNAQSGEKFIKMKKPGEQDLEVHPTAVKAHEKAGWAKA